MEVKKAKIYWTARLSADGTLNLNPGRPYYPHIILVDDPSEERWSVRFVVTDINKEMESSIELSMLVNNFESRCFLEKLSPGTQFALFEGKTQVARGIIV